VDIKINNWRFLIMIESDKERQAPKNLDETELTHLVRYKFALDFISDDDVVLDAPCGSGYGTNLLTKKSKKVYGVDIFQPAIDHANELFLNDYNCFFACDVLDMSMFVDYNFSVVVSFEGIEHVRDPDKFLLEIKRILTPDGMLIISTPKKPHGSPFHIVEFTLDEFKKILSKYFVIEKMYGQIYTDIFDLEKKKVNLDDYKHFNFIAVCRNGEI
jgi:2-polyprenyl-3-methyl-5-hydroxy-6-metoxy-1,4-benzoquinol methylase